jgi:Zn-dependent oligopeptidase
MRYGVVHYGSALDLLRFSNQVISSSRGLLSSLTSLSSSDVLGVCDFISNQVCLVAEPALFAIHMDQDTLWRQHATSAYTQISAFIQELNTNTNLLNTLELVQPRDQEDDLMKRDLLLEMIREGARLEHTHKLDLHSINSKLHSLEHLTSYVHLELFQQ